MRSCHRAVPGLGLLALLCSLACLADDTPQAAYRKDLVDLIEVVQAVRERAGPEAPGSDATLERAGQLFAQFDDAQIDRLSASLPARQLHALLTEAQRGLLAHDRASPKTAVAAAPNVTPAFCSDYPAPVVYAALATKLVTRHVIEAAEFTCHTSVLGFNAALGCEAPEIAAATAEIASALADFCGNQQGAATNTALLETERSVGRHLNAQLDAPLSSRATQVSADAAASDLAAADAQTADLRATLAQDFVQIDAQLDDAIADLAGLTSQLSDIQSRTDEVVFRVQATQVEVEDAQDRSADLQARLATFDTTLAQVRTQANQLATSSATLTPNIQASARQQRRDDLGLALGDSTASPGILALPGNAGGRLEEAREIVIEAITALQAMAQGNTAAALVSLAAGDTQYNLGHYQEAWGHYAMAYRQLDPHVGQQVGAPP